MQLNLHNFATLANAVVWAKDSIDAAAGRARARYLTIASGQDATYSAKYADAKAYITAGYPADATNYPWVKAEAAASGLATQQAADRIKQTGDGWAISIGPHIEGTRIGGKDKLAGLTTIADVIASAYETRTTLDAI